MTSGFHASYLFTHSVNKFDHSFSRNQVFPCVVENFNKGDMEKILNGEMFSPAKLILRQNAKHIIH
jgi:hypothetical protein